MPDKPFILASGSPQRKAILQKLGLSFKIVPADLDEERISAHLKRPHAVARFLALKKAEAVATKHPGHWVMGVDTLVVSRKGEIFGKPKDRKVAERMIRSFSGTYTDVYSGIAMVMLKPEKLNKKSVQKILMNKKFIQYEKTRLHFRGIPSGELKIYLDSGKWKGRSGAMTIEDAGSWLRKMEGDYWNVVGVPVERLKLVLMGFLYKV